ncbi:MAG TPA: hypothetical protein VLE43_10170 [Candidatus Saccharimonadia bacterium]|nr:hypothetical protein [Candidatus Saccharimonadia bacterium]
MELNYLTMFVFLFAGGSSLLCYGLMKRPTWMWYLGWWMFFLFAIVLGDTFVPMFTSAQAPADFAMAICWLVGWFLLWLFGVTWWSANRHRFGKKKVAAKGM